MFVFLIRHGETITSGKSYAGRSDVPLTEHGRTQARALAEAMAAERLTHILCSPLSRALDTADPLAQRLGLKPLVTPALAEIDFGHLEGCSKGVLGRSLRKAHAHLPIPGGEALVDVWHRAGEVIGHLPRDPASRCAIVGHFWINRLVWGRLQGLSFEAACASRAYRPATGSCLALDVQSDPLASHGPGGPRGQGPAPEAR